MKKVLCLVCAITMAMALSACGNRQVFDTTYTFNKAIISLPDGTVVEGKVSSCEKKGLFSFEIFGGVRVECSGCGARTKPETGDEKCDAYFSAAEKWNNGDIV